MWLSLLAEDCMLLTEWARSVDNVSLSPSSTMSSSSAMDMSDPRSEP